MLLAGEPSLLMLWQICNTDKPVLDSSSRHRFAASLSAGSICGLFLRVVVHALASASKLMLQFALVSLRYGWRATGNRTSGVEHVF
jgi:hypothetical protein